MIGYDYGYPYPIQVETITPSGVSYTSGHRDRGSALAYARELVATRHAGTTCHDQDCAVVVHTPYASRVVYRPQGMTDAAIAGAA